MADISILSRLINGVQRNVDISANTLVTTSIKVGGLTPTELTKAILDNLIALQNGTDFATGTNAHTHDGRYYTETELGAQTNGASGASKIGIDVTPAFANFTSGSNVQSALEGIDTALGAGASDIYVKVSAADTTAGYLNSKISAGSALSSSITSPGANEVLDLAVNVDDSTIEVNTDALRLKALGITNSHVSATAAIAYSKLNLTTSIVNGDINASAAIAYSKLNLATSIVNADIAAAAAIALTKLAALISGNRALASNASGFIVESSVTDTELGYVSGVTSSIQTQINSKVAKAGDTMTGTLAMGVNKVTSSYVPDANNVLANKLYVDGLVSGAVWLSPIIDPDLVNDSLSAPPGSPVNGDVYIVGATATGLWTGLEGYALFTTDGGTSWTDLLGRAVIAGDRFGVSMETATAGAGGLAAQDDKIATVVSPTPGSVTYSFETPSTNKAVYVSNAVSSHAGHQYNYNGSAWVEFGGLVAVNAGSGLELVANVLNVKMGAGIIQLPTDEVGVDVHADGALMTTVDNSTSSTVTAAQLAVKLDGSTLAKTSAGLKVATGGISNNEVNAAAAIAYSKLALSNSIVNADIAAGAAIVDTKLATIATANKVSGSAIQLATNSGLEDSTGLKIKPDSTTANTLALTLTANGAGTKYDANSFTEVSEALALASAVAGAGLALTTGVLSVNVDDSTIEINTDILRVKDLGITTAKIAAAAVDENKLATSVAGAGLTGGAGSALAVGANADGSVTVNANDIQVAFAPALKKAGVAGESFAANTSFAVRMALTGETAGRWYKADYDATSTDNFYAYGMIEGNGAAAKIAGDPIVVVMMGTATLGSSDANFAAGEVGQAAHLKAAGAWDAVSQITYAANQASYRVGMVQEVDKILVGNMQLLGIN